jgi:hypothetical protein
VPSNLPNFHIHEGPSRGPRRAVEICLVLHGREAEEVEGLLQARAAVERINVKPEGSRALSKEVGDLVRKVTLSLRESHGAVVVREWNLLCVQDRCGSDAMDLDAVGIAGEISDGRKPIDPQVDVGPGYNLRCTPVDENRHGRSRVESVRDIPIAYA